MLLGMIALALLPGSPPGRLTVSSPASMRARMLVTADERMTIIVGRINRLQAVVAELEFL
eukprot:6262393-Prymnesium_polylepis.1